MLQRAVTQADRRLFYLAAIWNWGTAALFLLGERPLRDLLGFPLVGDDIFRDATASLVVAFGIGYYWVGRDPSKNHAVVGVGALGNILLFSLALAHAVAGTWPYALPLLILPDLVFGALFVRFLLRVRTIAPAGLSSAAVGATIVDFAPPATPWVSAETEVAAISGAVPPEMSDSTAPTPADVPAPTLEPLAAVSSVPDGAASELAAASEPPVQARESLAETTEPLAPPATAAALARSAVVAAALDDGPRAAPAQRAAARSAAGGLLLLQLQTTRAPAPTFEVTRSGATLGRGPENTIRLEDLSVSRRHARITYRQGGYWIVDLGSTSGTWVEGTRLKQAQRVEAGQIIDIGICRMTTAFSGEAVTAPKKAASRAAERRER